VVEVRLRLPRKLMPELRELADSEDLSINAMVATFIDAALVERGRQSIVQIAPLFSSYLRGSGRSRQVESIDGQAAAPKASAPDFT
jgi:hypothetical protein